MPLVCNLSLSSRYNTFFGEEICSSGSPWAIDSLLVASGVLGDVDHLFHAIFCRLGELQQVVVLFNLLLLTRLLRFDQFVEQDRLVVAGHQGPPLSRQVRAVHRRRAALHMGPAPAGGHVEPRRVPPIA